LNTSNVQVKRESLSAGFSKLVYLRAGSAKSHVASPPPVNVHPDETLVVDDRVRVRPAQAIESRLTRWLQGAYVPVSHLQMRGLLTIR